MLGTLSPEQKSDWKNSIGAMVHTYNCTQNSATGFSLYFLIYWRQPCLPIDVTLGLAPKLVTAPTSTKYVQRLREHIKWVHRKANQFHQKEAWCHKQNYDRCSRAVARGKEVWSLSISLPSRVDTRYIELMGRTGSIGRMAALTQYTSLCSMPKEWGRAQPDPI